jgi:hypothetical protein
MSDTSASGFSVKSPNALKLTAVLNTLIPAEDGFPPAGEAAIQATFAKDVAADGNEVLVVQLLNALPDDFASRSSSDREHILKSVEAEQGAMFGAVLRHVYNAYWSNQTVREQLEKVEGYPARPPLYAGYEMDPFDPETLAVQRKREPFWRKA